MKDKIVLKIEVGSGLVRPNVGFEAFKLIEYETLRSYAIDDEPMKCLIEVVTNDTMPDDRSVRVELFNGKAKLIGIVTLTMVGGQGINLYRGVIEFLTYVEIDSDVEMNDNYSLL